MFILLKIILMQFKINAKKTTWNLELDGFSVRYEIVNNNIFHLISKGTFSEEQSLYDRFPFNTYIYHSGSRFINIGLALGTPFINFKFKKVKHFDDVLTYVNKNKKITNKNPKVKKVSDETQAYFLVKLIGKMMALTKTLKNLHHILFIRFMMQLH